MAGRTKGGRRGKPFGLPEHAAGRDGPKRGPAPQRRAGEEESTGAWETRGVPGRDARGQVLKDEGGARRGAGRKKSANAFEKSRRVGVQKKRGRKLTFCRAWRRNRFLRERYACSSSSSSSMASVTKSKAMRSMGASGSKENMSARKFSEISLFCALASTMRVFMRSV